MKDGTTYYVEEVRTHKKTLSAKTMFRFEGMLSSDFVNQKLRSTSETLPSAITFVPAFNQNISSGNFNVKRVDENGKLYSQTEGDTLCSCDIAKERLRE